MEKKNSNRDDDNNYYHQDRRPLLTLTAANKPGMHPKNDKVIFPSTKVVFLKSLSTFSNEEFKHTCSVYPSEKIVSNSNSVHTSFLDLVGQLGEELVHCLDRM